MSLKRSNPYATKRKGRVSRAVKMSAQPGLTGAGLLPELRQLIQTARHTVAVAVNSALTTLYWQIGVRIRREILREKRAAYGEEIVQALSAQLSEEFGRGFTARNLFNMIRFSEVFPDRKIVSALMTQLGWTYLKHLICFYDRRGFRISSA